MEDAEISRIVTALHSAIKEAVQAEVNVALQEIPYRVQQHLDNYLAKDIRERITKLVERRLSIVVSIKE